MRQSDNDDKTVEEFLRRRFGNKGRPVPPEEVNEMLRPIDEMFEQAEKLVEESGKPQAP